MLTWAKYVVKRLPYAVFLPLFLLHSRLNEARGWEAARRKHQIPLLTAINLERVKHSDTVFLLGSGPSINQISSARWRVIGAHDSIACNFWLCHAFVPRIYFFELIDRAESPGEYNRFLELTRARAADYEPTLKIVSELCPERAAMFSDLSPSWLQSVYTFVPVRLAARNNLEFASGIRYLKSKGVFRASTRIRTLFKYGTSLTAMVALAIMMQYRRIVLCGIDLNTSVYFHGDASLYPQATSPSTAPKFLAQQDVAWRIKLDSVLKELKCLVLDPEGIEIYVENRSSALWPAIAEAPKELFEGEVQPTKPRFGTVRERSGEGRFPKVDPAVYDS